MKYIFNSKKKVNRISQLEDMHKMKSYFDYRHPALQLN